MSDSLGARWDAANGRPVGFDILRVFLSVAVILFHTALVCYGKGAEEVLWGWPYRQFSYFIVPSFFALSGFLVAGSLERNDLLSFLALRIIRIFPALVVEVVVSALLIGALFTVLPLRQYAHDPVFFKYFLNMLGDIQFNLPGVFLDLPGGRFVNRQLWTVPFELKCYILLTLAAMVGLARRPMLFLALALGGYGWAAFRHYTYYTSLANESTPSGELLILSFLLGVILYLMRQKISVSVPYFVASVILCSVLCYLPVSEFLLAIPVAYMTVFLGVLNFRVPYVSALGNYSYGLYLYGFPVQQAVSALLPDYRVWWIHFPISLALSMLLAALSWHLVEAKVMKQKKTIIGFMTGAGRLLRAQVRRA